MTDLVLDAQIYDRCLELIEEQHRADLLRAHNLEPRHRILLCGPPGNGKTTLAEAIAFELSVPLLSVRYDAVITSYLGETAVRLAQLFAEARMHRCVLFFDEFDVLGKERGDAHETGEIKRVVSSLLLQIDQLPSHVVVIAATNHEELLDRAAWRRFEMQIDLPRPTAAACDVWLRQFETRTGVSIAPRLRSAIPRKLRPKSFSELEQFVLDVQRRYVLSLPDANYDAIVASRLKRVSRRKTSRRKRGTTSA
jgi:AAA+ superfamily predicted ATPase